MRKFISTADREFNVNPDCCSACGIAPDGTRVAPEKPLDRELEKDPAVRVSVDERPIPAGTELLLDT